MNSPMSLQEPVPDKDWTAATLASLMAEESSPYASLTET